MRFVLLIVLGLCGCDAGSAIEVGGWQTRAMLALEAHPDGSAAYQFWAVTFVDPSVRAVVNYNREADRTATIRYITNGACATPRYTLEREVPFGRSMVRRYWRVEC